MLRLGAGSGPQSGRTACGVVGLVALQSASFARLLARAARLLVLVAATVATIATRSVATFSGHRSLVEAKLLKTGRLPVSPALAICCRVLQFLSRGRGNAVFEATPSSWRPTATWIAGLPYRDIAGRFGGLEERCGAPRLRARRQSINVTRQGGKSTSNARVGEPRRLL